MSLVTKRNMPLVNTGRRRPSRYWNAEGRNGAFEDYEGTIHCVKVPNALLVLRRNGKPVVSGSLITAMRGAGAMCSTSIA